MAESDTSNEIIIQPTLPKLYLTIIIAIPFSITTISVVTAPNTNPTSYIFNVPMIIFSLVVSYCFSCIIAKRLQSTYAQLLVTIIFEFLLWSFVFNGLAYMSKVTQVWNLSNLLTLFNHSSLFVSRAENGIGDPCAAHSLDSILNQICGYDVVPLTGFPAVIFIFLLLSIAFLSYFSSSKFIDFISRTASQR